MPSATAAFAIFPPIAPRPITPRVLPNISGPANSNAVKELAICALLLSSRKITEAAAWAASLKGTPDAPKTVEGGKSKFAGPEILGRLLA